MWFVFIPSKEPIKVAKPKPKKPSEEHKKSEKTKVELKRRIPQEFQDFGECKFPADTCFMFFMFSNYTNFFFFDRCFS